MMEEGPRDRLEVLADEERRRKMLRRQRARRRILRSTAVLPALCTVLNGLSGFAAIHFATKDALGSASMMNLTIGAWMVAAAMLFDMLDGRLARLTRRTSDFGAQLDSLSDAISFGVAPAVLMLRAIITTMREYVNHLTMERVVWCVAGVYVACALLRLARFNVETERDESAHMEFSGLPSPGAAALVAAMVALIGDLQGREWTPKNVLYPAASVALPLVTLAVALLMVSRFRYPHVMNKYFRGRRPFNFLVAVVLLVLAAIMELILTGAIVAMVFALFGPVDALVRKLRKPAEQHVPPPSPI